MKKSEGHNTGKKIKNKENKKPFTFKTYLREFLLFVDKYLIKNMKILFIIAILLIAILLGSMVDIARASECEGACMDGITLWSDYISKIQILLFTLVAGIVPYVYVAVLGFAGYLLGEISNIAYIIKGYGYFKGILIGIVPLILDVFVICIVTALAIYVCRTITVGYRISSTKNMNFTNFRIRLYDVLGKQDKVDALTKKKQEKLEKLENRKERLNYLQILNIAIVVGILQLLSALIQHILV